MKFPLLAANTSLFNMWLNHHLLVGADSLVGANRSLHHVSTQPPVKHLYFGKNSWPLGNILLPWNATRLPLSVTAQWRSFGIT